MRNRPKLAGLKNPFYSPDTLNVFTSHYRKRMSRGGLGGLAKARYSEALPRDSIFRRRHDHAPAARSASVQSFLCRHSEKLENAHQENYFHSVLRLRQPVSIVMPRGPALRNGSIAPRSRCKEQKEIVLPHPAFSTGTIQLTMNDRIPPSALPPVSSVNSPDLLFSQFELSDEKPEECQENMEGNVEDQSEGLNQTIQF
jgi:hypothetical protein